MSSSESSILIVGGGVFGFTSALELRSRGWAVTLMDQGVTPHPDAASTDISKVVRTDYGADAVYTEMAERSLDGWCLWNAAWPQPVFHQDGFLVLSPEAELRPGTFEGDSFVFLTARGQPLRALDAESLAKNHPPWARSGHRSGYLNPLGGWAGSGRVVEQLRRIALEKGVAVLEQAPVVALLSDGARVAGARAADGSEHRADAVLVAAGAWTPFLLPELCPAMRVTGQPVVHLRPRDPAAFRAPAFPVWASDIGRTGWYGFPAMDDGIVKIANHGPGTVIERPDQARMVAPDEVERVLDFVREKLPGLADAPVAGTRQCWYCDTFDGHFFIGHAPDRPGLIVAAGDSGHAFKFAPVLGGLIADIVEHKPNPWAHRFQWREPSAKSGESARAA